jgi:UDP-N-acetylglucosamine:LPS N-acetylglucosamine transferase
VTKIDFLYFDAGGGHRAAATALKSVIEEQKRPWEIRLVNLQELLDPLDVFRKVTGIRLENLYNQMLAKGWTLGVAEVLKLVHVVIRMNHKPTVRLLQEHWMRTRPEMVVSLVPNFNRALHQSLCSALPAVPFITILTDFADYPPHFWIERATPAPQFIVCGTEKALEQARALGHAPERVFRTSGMILRPRFYEPVTVDRAQERRRLGLDPERPTGLVLFGGQGSKVMMEIARRLPGTQLILICGHNRELAERLKALPGKAPRFVEGFTSEIPYYMQLADFFLGKPGPGSVSEAMAMQLPVILECNAWTLPQERYNAEWVIERNTGIVLRNFRQVAEAVDRMLGNLTGFRENVGKIQNRAVFEIPEIFERILN